MDIPPFSLDLFQGDKLGRTPLHGADNVGITQMLLDEGASPSIQAEDGNTPLHVATIRGDLEVVMLLAPLSNLNLVGTFPFLSSTEPCTCSHSALICFR